MGGAVAAVAGPSIIETLNKGLKPGWDGKIGSPPLAEIERFYNDAMRGSPMIGGAYSRFDGGLSIHSPLTYRIPYPRMHARIYGIGVPK